VNWLFKEEPSHYSYDDLVRDGRRAVRRAQRRRAEAPARREEGDPIFYYHTATKNRSSRSRARASDAYPDPQDRDGKLYGRRRRAGREARAPSRSRRSRRRRRCSRCRSCGSEGCR
jgi:predicted RNA-binding protein with PUA-like domain